MLLSLEPPSPALVRRWDAAEVAETLRRDWGHLEGLIEAGALSDWRNGLVFGSGCYVL